MKHPTFYFLHSQVKKASTTSKYQVLSPLDVRELVTSTRSSTHWRPVVQVSLKTDSRLLQLQVDLIFPADWQFEGYV